MTGLRRFTSSPAWLVVLLLLAAPQLAWASGEEHQDPSAAVMLWCALILVVAKLGGHLARRFRQPAVLGELVGGVLLGNLPLLGVDGLHHLATDPFLDMLARLGVVLLLFEVGLESSVGQMLKVGGSALLVAVVGVTVPFFLGWGVAAWLLPHASIYVHVFVGATLTATSVGITARVLKDLSAMNSREARIILGAAVIDDVLGLIILAVVGGVIAAAATGQPMHYGQMGLILLKATGFLVGAVLVGRAVAGRMFTAASALDVEGVLLALGLGTCFLLSWTANAMGLATIVGAFAAGLILDDVHFRKYRERGEHGLEELVHPISGFLVPIFFVMMGMRTDLRAFMEPGVLGLAAALTAVAVVGKLLAGLGAMGKGIKRLIIGIGMIPRGEVGLIFANIGMGLTLGGERVITPAVFSALVVMIIVTTVATPPMLTFGLKRWPPAPLEPEGRPAAAFAEPAPPPAAEQQIPPPA